MYNIPIECGIPMRIVIITQMCLNKHYSIVQVGKHLCDMFPIKNGLKNKMLYHEVQENWDGLKLNGKCQLLVYADDVNKLGGSIHTLFKNNTEALVVATKEIGLEVNADKTKYMVMSGDQNAG